jgi:cytochrome c oxidase subunit 2
MVLVLWYWSYRYPDHGDFEFESYIVDEEDLEADQVRLLTVDNSVKIPVDTTIKVLVSTDPDGVIHNWAVPAFGIKMDAVPGRLNETWMKVTNKRLP